MIIGLYICEWFFQPFGLSSQYLLDLLNLLLCSETCNATAWHLGFALPLPGSLLDPDHLAKVPTSKPARSAKSFSYIGQHTTANQQMDGKGWKGMSKAVVEYVCIIISRFPFWTYLFNGLLYCSRIKVSYKRRILQRAKNLAKRRSGPSEIHKLSHLPLNRITLFEKNDYGGSFLMRKNITHSRAPQVTIRPDGHPWCHPAVPSGNGAWRISSLMCGRIASSLNLAEGKRLGEPSGVWGKLPIFGAL